jgi:hypothetical protein
VAQPEVSPLVFLKSKRATAAFGLAAAVTAAAVLDPLVEFLANRGCFGTGNFTDHSNVDVLPSLAMGLLFLAIVVAGSAWRALSRRRYAPAWLRACAVRTTVTRLFPGIFAAQLAMLWSMETLEQLVVAGRPLGGTLWLGAPAPIALALHAAGGFALTLALARVVRWSAETLAHAVVAVCEFFRAHAPVRSLRVRSQHRVAVRFLEPMLARQSGRAPPRSHLAAMFVSP